MSRELDALVAEHVMGWERLPVPRHEMPTPPPGSFTIIVDLGAEYFETPDGARFLKSSYPFGASSVVPAFSTDLTAAALVEDAIAARHLHYTYLDALCQIVGLSSDGIGGRAQPFDFAQWMCAHVSGDALWLLVRATPEQRCQAALIAVGAHQ